ncbi:MAG: response regulator [Spirochaetales bacterium]|jgi:putative two-component system response regulator|nr:response regulator [Spirochaetales bacterium]
MKQILIVDDNISILKQISAYLTGDYEVSLAKSGLLALQICMKERPDLILLDIEMPEMNGFETIRRLKQNPYFNRIPVIFLTANQDVETEVRGLQSGARDFITKPVEKSILIHRIELHLRLSSYQAETESKVMNMSDSIATAFAELIECRDENTGGHVVRTSRYVDLLGRELIRTGAFSEELTLDALTTFVRAAPLHDIGKVAISDKILLKPGRLEENEFREMKRHAAIGAQILERMYERTPTQNYLSYAALIAASHHERWDGKGYPSGLAQGEIPLCGRIMAVADVYDALIDNRVYRKGMNPEEARKIILEGKGAHFDPQVVDAFSAVCEELTALKDSAPEAV